MAIILKEIPYKIKVEKVLANLHLEKDSEDGQRVLKLIEQAEDKAVPKGLFKEAFIEQRFDDGVLIEGTRFKSRILRVNLDKVERVFPYIVTCGQELELWANTFTDMLENYWADIIQEAILNQAVRYLFNYITDKYHPGACANMNPGSLKDWPISEQEKLFHLLGNQEEEIGVTLTDSYLMIPRKTVSGIRFPTEVNYVNCQLCPRDNCPGRRAPYDENLYQQKYARNT